MWEAGLRPSVGARTTWGGYFIAELPAQGDQCVHGVGEGQAGIGNAFTSGGGPSWGLRAQEG